MLSSLHPFSASHKSHSSQLPNYSFDHYSSPQHLQKAIKSLSSLDQPTIIKQSKNHHHHHQERNSIKPRPTSIFSTDFDSDSVRDFNRVQTIIHRAIDTRTLVVDLSNQSLSTIPSCINQLEVLISSSSLLDKPIDQQKSSNPTLPHRTLTRVSSAPSVFDSYTSNPSIGLNIILSNNQLTNIKPLISNLKFITTLSLRSNQIKFIPTEIQELNQLIKLNLTNNQIQFLPNSILNLIKQNHSFHLLISGNPLLKKPLNQLTNQRILSKPIYFSKIQSLQKSCLSKICIKSNSNQNELNLLKIEDFNQKVKLPNLLIHQILNSIEFFWKCDQCNKFKNDQFIECFEWIQINQSNQDLIPFQFKFCNQICFKHFLDC